MTIGFYSQDEEGSPYFEEDPDNRLVCPECDEDVLIAEHGHTWLCEGCYEEGFVGTLDTRVPILTQLNKEVRTK